MGVAANRAGGLGVSVNDLQVLCIMTALDESSLVNVNHGDAAGPDSTGLFQQRDSWGTRAQRMDPGQSTGLFIDAVAKIPGYRLLIVNSKPTLAQAVQKSGTPSGSNYLAQLGAATQLVKDEAGNSAASTAPVTQQQMLQALAPTLIGKAYAGSTVKTAVYTVVPGNTGTYILIGLANGNEYALYPDGHASQTTSKVPAAPAQNWLERMLSIEPVIPGSPNNQLEQAYHNAVGNTPINQNPVSDGANNALNWIQSLTKMDFQNMLWIGAGGLLILAGVLILTKNQLPAGTVGTAMKVAAL
jgi:hypothetical protein